MYDFGNTRSRIHALASLSHGEAMLEFNSILRDNIQYKSDAAFREQVVQYMVESVNSSGLSKLHKWTMITNLAIAFDIEAKTLNRPRGAVFIIRDAALDCDWSDEASDILGDAYEEVVYVFTDRRSCADVDGLRPAARERWDRTNEQYFDVTEQCEEGIYRKRSHSEFGAYVETIGDLMSAFEGRSFALQPGKGGSFPVLVLNNHFA